MCACLSLPVKVTPCLPTHRHGAMQQVQERDHRWPSSETSPHTRICGLSPTIPRTHQQASSFGGVCEKKCMMASHKKHIFFAFGLRPPIPMPLHSSQRSTLLLLWQIVSLEMRSFMMERLSPCVSLVRVYVYVWDKNNKATTTSTQPPIHPHKCKSCLLFSFVFVCSFVRLIDYTIKCKTLRWYMKKNQIDRLRLLQTLFFSLSFAFSFCLCFSLVRVLDIRRKIFRLPPPLPLTFVSSFHQKLNIHAAAVVVSLLQYTKMYALSHTLSSFSLFQSFSPLSMRTYTCAHKDTRAHT